MEEQIEQDTENPTTKGASTEIKDKKKLSSKRTLRNLLFGVSAVIFLSVFALIGMLFTDIGQRGAIRLTDHLWDSFSVGQVDGGLQQGLVLHDVRFQSDGVISDIKQARLHWNLNCLWQADICLKDLTLIEPQIQIDSSLLSKVEEEQENTPIIWHKIQFPVSIFADNITLNNAFISIDNHKIYLETLNTSARLDNEKGLILAPTQINHLVVESDFSSNLRLFEKQPKKEEKNQPLDWHQLETLFRSPLASNLQKFKLPFNIVIQDLQGKNWQYRHIRNEDVNAIDISFFQLQAEGIDEHIVLNTLKVNSSLADIDGRGSLLLKEQFPLALNIQLNIKQQTKNNKILLPTTEANLHLIGDLMDKTTLSIHADGMASIVLEATARLNQQNNPLNLKLNIKNFQYPFDPNEKDLFYTPELDLYLDGDLLTYQGEFSGDIRGSNVPKTKINSLFYGGISAINFEKLQLELLKGKANLQGSLDWKQGLKWQSAVDFNNINLTQYFSEIPSILFGKFIFNGQLDRKKWQIAVPILDLRGTLSKRSLMIKGDLASDNEYLFNSSSLLINYGENKIKLNGHLGKNSDLNLDIAAPDLRGLLPHFSASLLGKLKFSGNLIQPTLEADLRGNNFRFQDINVNQFALKGQMTSDELVQGNIAFNMKGLNFNKIQIPSVVLTIAGDEKNHRFHLRSQGEPVAVNLYLGGKFDRDKLYWRGTVTSINITSPVGNWTTNQDIYTSYSSKLNHIRIAPHCWQNSDIDLCFPQHMKIGKSGDILFDLKKVDLNLVNKLIDQNLFVGRLRSTGKFEWFTDKSPQFNLKAEGNNLSLSKKIGYRTFQVVLPKFNFNTVLQQNTLVAESSLQVSNRGNLGNINANIKLQDLLNKRMLKGALNIDRLNLSLFNQLLSSGENISGDIDANLILGGSLNAPLLNGSVNINELSAVVKTLPFDIKKGQINIGFQGNHSTLQGYIKNADSRLDIGGDANWQDLNRWNTRIYAKASEFNINIPSVAKLKVSPDIEIKAAPKLLTLSGQICVPWARIAIDEMPESAVSPSSDVVILDGPDKTRPKIHHSQLEAKTKSGMEIRSDLKINVGNDVKLDSYGLNTNLNGVLSVKQEKNKLGLFGQINLKNGRYNAFGQDLLIRKGQINFSGLPSQPLLNVEAIRNPTAMENSNIVAGVKVVGIATSPKVTVFSEPAMSQDQALSYLLTGRSLENIGSESGSSGGSIGAALLSIGLAKSGKLVGSIGESFGIQDLNLGTQGIGDKSQVVVSGNITSRLQVKYGIGIFDGLAEFTLRYKLLPQLYLQSVSGVNQAVDLLYQFEF